MIKWLEKKLPIEKLRNDLRINDEYFEKIPLPPSIVSPAMLQVFQIPLITNKIFHYLTHPDLSNCRLVHPSWTDPVSNFILQNDMTQVTIYYDDVSKTYNQNRPYTAKKRFRILIAESLELGIKDKKRFYTLQHLNKILEISTNFPSNRFHFYGGNLADTEPRHFFQNYGHLIKTLELYNTQLELQIDLHVKGRSKKNSKVHTNVSLDSTEFLVLPSLTTFYFVNSPSTVEAILSKATNLKFIPKIQFPYDLPVLLQTNKVPTLQSLKVKTSHQPEDISKFLKANPILRRLSLTINFDQPHEDLIQWTDILNQLLESNKNSLEKLTSIDLCLNPNLIWPTFKNLHSLKLRCLTDPPTHCFIPGFNLQEKFPHLNTLDLTGLNCQEDDNWDSYFPSFPITLPHVLNLTLPDKTSQVWLENIGRWCPNFKNLKLKHVDVGEFIKFSNTLTSVFKMCPHLEIIELDCLTEGIANLDSVLTGMDQQVCEKLKTQFNKTDEHCDIRNLLRANQKFRDKYNNLKINPSICDLKGLKKFRLNCDELCMWHEHEFPVTWVSGLFAFGMMSQWNSVGKLELIYTKKSVDLRKAPGGLRQYHSTLLPYAKLKCPSYAL